MQTPSVGRIVHYVSHGTPGGEYGKECRAAIVTQVSPESNAKGDHFVGLCVLNPTGQFFNPAVPYDEWDGTEPLAHLAEPQGGSWHWPERTS
jgi:hypothetical protein